MLALTLSEIAAICEGRVVGDGNVCVHGVSTDSRAITKGSLFVAIKGERFDGHDHVASATSGGAAACLLSRVAPGVTAVVVEETIAAFQRMTKAWRDRMRLSVLALTGSNGKTTVKEMLRAILVAHHDGRTESVLTTEGNLNNHLGVPMMLARLNVQHRHAVFEAGMNHFGEIRLLTHLISPDVALINNAGPAHLEGVGDLEGVARAKGEIFEGLAHNGTAVLNADDAYVEYWRALLRPTQAVVSFGRNPAAMIRGEWADVSIGATMRIHHASGAETLTLPLAGQHNRMNALAATAGAFALGIPVRTAARALATVTPVQGRQVVYKLPSGATLIDDTYNANPASVTAAMDSLATRAGHRILVLGQLAELGEQSEAAHREIGQCIGKSAIDSFLATGERMQVAVEMCNAIDRKGQWFANKAQLIDNLRAQLGATSCVLVKGSRSSAMEEVVHAFLPHRQTQEGH